MVGLTTKSVSVVKVILDEVKIFKAQYTNRL